MYFKRFTSMNWFTSGLRLWSNRIPLRFDSYSGSCTNFCSYCVEKGTLISTMNGLIPIEELKITDLIMSRDISRKRNITATIIKTMNREVNELFELKTKNNTLYVTGEHPILTKHGWIKVKSLKDGDVIWTENTSWSQIINKNLIKKKTTVYNIEVDPNNNYYANDVLVHNCYARQVSQGGLARQGIKYDPQIIKIGNLDVITKACNSIFNENTYDSRSYQQYWLLHRGLIENGTMSDPFLKEEVEMLNTYNLLQIANAYKLPLYFNTKGNALINSEKHFDAICNLNKNGGGLFDISLTSNNDKLIKKFEPKAPLPSERLTLIKRMTDNNIDVIASARPIIKGVTDVDYENYIGELCDVGVKSIHLRTLIISGKQLKSEFWKKYAKENEMIFKNISYRYPMDYFMDLFERAMDVAKSKGVGVTASHTLFFKFGTANKCDYSKVSQKIQDSLFNPGLETILHNTYKHRKKPQMLYYDEILKPHFKKNKEFMNHRFLMDDKTSSLIWSSSCTMKVRIKYLLSGKKIAKQSLWNGWERNATSDAEVKQMLRSGYIASVNGIHTIINKEGEQVLDENGNIIYAYIPEEYKEHNYIKSTHVKKADVISVKELKELGLSI